MDSDRQENPNEQPPVSLNAGDVQIVAELVADATVANVPLPDALRAAAEESDSSRLSTTLRQLAMDLEKGRSLADICQASGKGVPRFVAGLMRAASRSGDLATALTEWLDCQRIRRQTWRTVTSAMIYPTVLMSLSLGLLWLFDYLLIGPMLEMYEEFELQLPAVTMVLAWLHEYGMPFVLTMLLFLVLAGFGVRIAAGPSRWRRLLQSLPIVGMIWHWTGVTEFGRLLAVLLRRQIPLDEALQLAADGVHDANMREVGHRLAAGVQKGATLSDLVYHTHRVPDSLIPLVRWGERSGRLDEAFTIVGDMYEGRARMRAELIASTLPPLVLIFLATLIPISIVGIYLPMVPMVQGLM